MSNLENELVKLTTLPLNMMQELTKAFLPGAGGQSRGGGNAANPITGLSEQMLGMAKNFCPLEWPRGDEQPCAAPPNPGGAHAGPAGTTSGGPGTHGGPGPQTGPVKTAPPEGRTGWGPMPTF